MNKYQITKKLEMLEQRIESGSIVFVRKEDPTLKELKKIEKDEDGYVKLQTVTPLVRSFLKITEVKQIKKPVIKMSK